ncbi:hypothetical protein [Burkholderia sp. BCC1999]|uniref:hypothetical protein n=1 Tax=Burkholderia sp. BCC1999 TaxID=2817448 RepID=UPI002AC33972|nr:hypothetical protein [Burkholderia sp. BCC1999]
MITDLNKTRIRTIEQVRGILDGTETLEFVPATDARARWSWIASVLGRLLYRRLKRANRGLVLHYLRRLSGFSRAHVNWLVRHWLSREQLVRPQGAPSNAFAPRYTDADLDALAEVEREYGRLSGPAIAAMLRRMYQVYGDERCAAAALVLVASVQPAPRACLPGSR